MTFEELISEFNSYREATANFLATLATRIQALENSKAEFELHREAATKDLAEIRTSAGRAAELFARYAIETDNRITSLEQSEIPTDFGELAGHLKDYALETERRIKKLESHIGVRG